MKQFNHNGKIDLKKDDYYEVMLENEFKLLKLKEIKQLEININSFLNRYGINVEYKINHLNFKLVLELLNTKIVLKKDVINILNKNGRIN